MPSRPGRRFPKATPAACPLPQRRTASSPNHPPPKPPETGTRTRDHKAHPATTCANRAAVLNYTDSRGVVELLEIAADNNPGDK